MYMTYRFAMYTQLETLKRFWHREHDARVKISPALFGRSRRICNSLTLPRRLPWCRELHDCVLAERTFSVEFFPMYPSIHRWFSSTRVQFFIAVRKFFFIKVGRETTQRSVVRIAADGQSFSSNCTAILKIFCSSQFKKRTQKQAFRNAASHWPSITYKFQLSNLVGNYIFVSHVPCVRSCVVTDAQHNDVCLLVYATNK